MATNLLEIPLKRTLPIDLQQPLAALFASHFSQPASEFAADLEALARQRNDIVELPRSNVGLSRLTIYFRQISYLSSKLPADTGIYFTWSNAMNQSITQTMEDLDFERANLLFNIAAMYSNLGLQENRTTLDGLKKANQQFQIAAGCFSTLQDLLGTTSFVKVEDFEKNHISALINVMLAQAQECIWQKAVLDQMKDKLIAQLSQQVSKFYGEASAALEKSTSMSPTWIHHLKLKSNHFAAAAQFRMSAFAVASSKYGEEVARLRLASGFCEKAAQHAPYVGRAVSKDLEGMTTHVKKTELHAEKDNDMIYVDPVPNASVLPAILPQVMVKPSVLPDLNVFSNPGQNDFLFKNLVPFVVHNMVDVFEQRKRDFITREIINPLHALDLEAQAVLQQEHLPGSLTVIEQPLGLPSSVASQSEEIRNKGGLKHLENLMDEVAALAKANGELIEQIIDLIDEDDLADNTTGVDPVGTETVEVMSRYRAQMAEYQSYLTQAEASDGLVRTKVQESRESIELLSSDTKTLASTIPTSSTVSMTRQQAESAHQVRSVLNRLNIIFKQRQNHIDHIQSLAEGDDIGPELIEHAKIVGSHYHDHGAMAEEYEPIVSRRLENYRKKSAFVAESAELQKNTIQDIIRTNKAFVLTKTASTPITQRESTIQSLDVSYHKYHEIINNLEEGAKFYSDFHKALCGVGDEVKLALQKLHDSENNEENHLVAATEQLDLHGKSTVIASGTRMTPGTWTPESGILFSPVRPVTRSATKAAVTSNIFDPQKHTIQFRSK